jgi:hypothetical protein
MKINVRHSVFIKHIERAAHLLYFAIKDHPLGDGRVDRLKPKPYLFTGMVLIPYDGN